MLGKKPTVHAAFLLLILAVAIQGKTIAKLDSTSVLAYFINGEVEVTGPLSHAAHAEGNDSDNQLAAVAGGQNFGTVVIDDPTLLVGETLSGNVMAPLTPSATPSEGEPQGSSAPAAKPVDYIVADGDTIGSIASKFNISNDTILWANKLSSSSVIRPGDHLTIPPTTGVLYNVKSGDTILSIANKFDIKAKEIVEFNKLEDSGRIALGQELMIPGARIDDVVPAQRPVRIADNDDSAPVPPSAKTAGIGGWLWPTATRHLSQYFGQHHHTGIDVDNRSSNVPIFASKDGVVQFSGWNSGGYGNLVVVNHGSNLSTFYAHASKLLVRSGQSVAKGQVIAIMGSTGRSTGPHLHFEIRRNGIPVNPLGMF